VGLLWGILAQDFQCDGFVVQSPQKKSPSSLNSVGNMLSGVTGVAPSKLLKEPLEEQLTVGTSLENAELECAYKGSRDGWSAIDFHEAVDGRGSCLVVVLSRSGSLFGGFNPLGWMSTDDYCNSNAAFLWFEKGNNDAVRSPILSGGNAAIFDYATGGPNFGAADLVIGAPQAAVMGGFAGPDMEDMSINAGNLKTGSSSPGGAYEAMSAWPIKGSFQLAEVEVYCNAKIKATGTNSGGPSWWPF